MIDSKEGRIFGEQKILSSQPIRFMVAWDLV
jgi:hypothetical protein